MLLGTHLPPFSILASPCSGCRNKEILPASPRGLYAGREHHGTHACAFPLNPSPRMGGREGKDCAGVRADAWRYMGLPSALPQTPSVTLGKALCLSFLICIHGDNGTPLPTTQAVIHSDREALRYHRDWRYIST